MSFANKILVIERHANQKVPTGELAYNMITGKQEIVYEGHEFKYDSYFCGKCGRLLVELGNFCSHCGVKFEGEERVESYKKIHEIFVRSKENEIK